jgi:hypothetical protein
MTINVRVRVTMTVSKMWVGGVNRSLGKYETTLEVTPEILFAISTGYMEYENMNLYATYNKEENVLHLHGCLQPDYPNINDIEQRIRNLIEKGWKFDMNEFNRYKT